MISILIMIFDMKITEFIGNNFLIMDGGTVADYDTHENLMKKTESLYYKLFMSQAENYKLEPVFLWYEWYVHLVNGGAER